MLYRGEKTCCFFVLGNLNCVFIKVFVITREKLAGLLFVTIYDEDISFCFN